MSNRTIASCVTRIPVSGAEVARRVHCVSLRMRFYPLYINQFLEVLGKSSWTQLDTTLSLEHASGIGVQAAKSADWTPLDTAFCLDTVLTAGPEQEANR